MTDKQRPRGIYLLPNLFTTAALFSGFFAILAAVDGHFDKAALAIFVAMLMDGLDGRVARMTHTQTDFGAEYDSLSDMVAFGLAPGLVIYLWGLQSLGRMGWFAAFIYVAGAALRLARFNSQHESTDKRYFHGLPSPAAAAVIGGFVWVAVDYEFDPELFRLPVGVLTLLVGLSMVSNFRYLSFKEIDFRSKVPFMVLVVIALVIAVVITEPPFVLFFLFLLYFLSGPVMYLFPKKKHNTDDPSSIDPPG
jgi:CDP-diacylglycerol--serine O-phosphatidyltransferase